jgi:hypothetical protein
MARRQHFGRGCDAAKAIGVDGGLAFGRPCPPFHFDEAKHPSAPGDDIDLAARRFRTVGKDAPTGEAQIPDRKRLAAPAVLLRPCPAVAHLSSSARA